MSEHLKKNFFFNFSIIIIVFCLDRISKLYVIFLSEKNLSPNLFSSKFLNFHLIWNEGIAFGLLSFDQDFYYNILTILILLITFLIIYLMLKSNGLEKFSYSMIIGGSFGNITDRLYYSAVPDFIDLNYNGYHWFVFNVADIFISVGIFALIFVEVFKKKNEN